MLYPVLADLVLAFHAGFVAFAILGGLLALRWRWIPRLQLPAVAWGALVEFTGWVCPLTPLENALRRAGGGVGHSSDFLEHYVSPLLYSSTLTRQDQFLLGFVLLLVNLGVYGFVWRHPRR